MIDVCNFGVQQWNKVTDRIGSLQKGFLPLWGCSSDEEYYSLCTYYDNESTSQYQSAANCNQLGQWTLVCSNVYDTVNIYICAGCSYIMGAQTLTQAGTYRDTLGVSGGCYRFRVVNLTVVVPTYSDTITQIICSNSSVSFVGHTYSTEGYYSQILQSLSGYDSMVTLHLIVHPTYYYSLSQTICTGDSINFGSYTYTTAGYYSETLQSMNGCDSTVTLHLIINPAYNDTFSGTICRGDTSRFDGNRYSVAGYYSRVFQTMTGCDSMITFHLTLNPTYYDTISQTICSGDSINFGSHTHTTAGYYSRSLFTANSCDSTITLHLTVLPTITSSLTYTICTGSSYRFGGHLLNQTGIYQDTLTTSSGCDSIVVLTLTVNNGVTNYTSQTICAGDFYFFGTDTLTQAGTYSDTLTAGSGCDSIETLILSVNPLPAKPTITDSGMSLTAAAAAHYQWLMDGIAVTGDTSSTLNLTGNGSYSVMVTDTNGCSNTSDTLLFTHLSINDIRHSSIRVYPNPNRGSFIVEKPQQQGAVCKIYDILGQIIQTQAIISTKQYIELGEVSKGIYTLMITGLSGAVKIMVE